MNTNDRRVLKTKKALYTSLMNLLKDKPLHKITVKELVDTADVHRATFYLHYQDIFDLYQKMEDELFADLIQCMEADNNHSCDRTYSSIVDFVYDNVDLAELAFGKSGNIQFRNRVRDLLVEKYLDIWIKEEHKKEITEQMQFITAYHIQGCMGIIERWLTSEFEITKNHIIDLHRKFDWNIENLC